jgi:hypothetical protein
MDIELDFLEMYEPMSSVLLDVLKQPEYLVGLGRAYPASSPLL